MSELEGSDAVVGGSARVLGADAGLDISYSRSNNRKIVTINPTLGFGLVATPYGIPVEVHGGAGKTKTITSTNGTKATTNAVNSTKTSIQNQLNNIAKQIKEIQKQIDKIKSKSKNSSW